jgi:hypothetical protein
MEALLMDLALRTDLDLLMDLAHMDLHTLHLNNHTHNSRMLLQLNNRMPLRLNPAAMQSHRKLNTSLPQLQEVTPKPGLRLVKLKEDMLNKAKLKEVIKPDHKSAEAQMQEDTLNKAVKLKEVILLVEAKVVTARVQHLKALH